MASENLYNYESIENVKIPTRQQNILINILMNVLVVVQLLGGWGGYTFFGNIFLGFSVFLGLLCILFLIIVDNKTFAKGHIIGWWSFFPLVIGLISLGFGWYFTWLVYSFIFGSMLIKKLIGDATLKFEADLGSPSTRPTFEDDESGM